MKLEISKLQILDNFDKFIIALPHHINVISALNPEILAFIAIIYIYIVFGQMV